jgi:hypothetical protein
MTAAAKDIKTDQFGTKAEPDLLSLPVAASTKIYAGTFVATDSSGNALPASATGTLKIWGRAEKVADNTSGAAGAISVEVRRGFFYFNNDTTNAITNSSRGAYVFALDDNVAGTSDLGGTLPVAGYVVDVPASGTPEYGKVLIAVGMARPDSLNPELSTGSSAFKARAVVTSLAAYTGSGTATLTASSNGAFGAQDGVTLVAGDVCFIQEGTTNLTAAKDAGPWQVSVIGDGSTKYVLIRPDWYAHGGAIVPGIEIRIGGEGTGTNPNLAGTTWKSFCAKSKVIGTDAPVFWPQAVTCAVTLASGTLASARTTIPVRAALSTSFVISSNPATAPHATTRLWRVSALTAGVTGTSSVQIVAESAPGTTNTSDVGQYNITAINW